MVIIKLRTYKIKNDKMISKLIGREVFGIRHGYPKNYKSSTNKGYYHEWLRGSVYSGSILRPERRIFTYGDIEFIGYSVFDTYEEAERQCSIINEMIDNKKSECDGYFSFTRSQIEKEISMMNK